MTHTGATAVPHEVASRASVLGALRRAPLMVKIAGASIPLLLAVLVVARWSRTAGELPRFALMFVLAACLATVVVHVALVALALQPLNHLGRSIEAFVAGNVNEVVSPSPWSDADMARLERSVARLFDGVRRDRDKARTLAARVLRQADHEQGRFASELFDSTAQSMAALLFELRALASSVTDARQLERLDGIRQIASGVLEEVKALSQEAHPGWSAPLGFERALQHLVRTHNEHSAARLTVETRDEMERLDLTTAGLVYRTAQAALLFAAQERCPGLDLVVGLTDGRVVLDVRDERERTAPLVSDPEALEVLRARAELLGGSLLTHRDGARRRLRLEVPVEAGQQGRITNPRGIP
jgi:signal transduction histidine kinase